MESIPDIRTREEFRAWLEEHAKTAKECYISCKRGRPTDAEQFWYLDAVEEALCFGWIDSTYALIDGRRMQRFSPRKKNSPWTELNKERVRRLEYLGKMTEEGRRILPDLDPDSFSYDPQIEQELKDANVWDQFLLFPPLYQRIRLSNLAAMKKRRKEEYEKGLKHLIEETRKGKLYGEWNDYGRLLEYEKEKKDE